MACVTADQAVLNEGTQGADVACIQKAVGADPDGVFGPQTRAKVVRFQSAMGIQADGVVGPETRRELEWSLDHMGHSSTPFRVVSVKRSAPTHTSTSHGSSVMRSGYSIPSRVVQCESKGNYSAVNSSSGAGGAYQILPSTWRAYGGSGSPQNASKSQQDAIAAKIWAASGSSAWSCK